MVNRKYSRGKPQKTNDPIVVLGHCNIFGNGMCLSFTFHWSRLAYVRVWCNTVKSKTVNKVYSKSYFSSCRHNPLWVKALCAGVRHCSRFLVFFWSFSLAPSSNIWSWCTQWGKGKVSLESDFWEERYEHVYDKNEEPLVTLKPVEGSKNDYVFLSSG